VEFQPGIQPAKQIAEIHYRCVDECVSADQYKFRFLSSYLFR